MILLKQILVIDDDKADLALMKKLLENEGHEVVAASNGSSAIDIVDSNYFDLILVDIKMKTVSGHDFVRLVKPRLGKKTMLVFVSIVPKKDTDTSNVDGFIQKPFSEKSFAMDVNAFFENPKMNL